MELLEKAFINPKDRTTKIIAPLKSSSLLLIIKNAF